MALPLWEGRYRGYGHHVQPCAAPLLVHRLFVIVGGNGALEVLLGRGPIVLGCDLLGVPAPPGRNVSREAVSELGGPAGSQVLPELGPGLGDAGPLDDSQELCPQVHRAVTVACDDLD